MDCATLLVGIILNLTPNWSIEKINVAAETICIKSEKYDINPLIPLSIIQHENPKWKTDVEYKNNNGSKDYGLMQFNCPVNKKKTKKWRKRWCTNEGIKKLKTIKGGISAGIEELNTKRLICYSKKNHIGSSGYNICTYNKYCIDCINNNCINKESNLSNYYIDCINKYCINCIDCFSVATVYTVYYNKIFKFVDDLKKDFINKKKFHWWVKHYNWRSKGGYDLKILYVLLSLQKRDNIYYEMIKRRFQVELAEKNMLKKCLTRNDLCRKEFEKWHQKRNYKNR